MIDEPCGDFPYDYCAAMRSVSTASAALVAKEISARELVDESIDRIEQFNEPLNAFVHVDVEGARAAADAIDERRAHGESLHPLAGIPFGVKDLEDASGMPTTRGSRWFAGDPNAERDDMHVERLRAAGAIPLGKTASPEFGAWAYTSSPALGTTRNPWNLSQTPGGSSGGSSAAVSAGLVPFCTASDGGGSIRTPAGFCGLPGLKSTYGRIPTWRVTHLSQNAVHGILAATVTDTAMLMDAIVGPHSYDRTSHQHPGHSYASVIDHLPTKGLKAAWSSDLGMVTAFDPAVVAQAEAAMRILVAAAGIELVEIDVRFDDYIMTYAHIEGVESFIDLPSGLYPERADELDPRVRPGWDVNAQVTLPKYAEAFTARRKLEHQVAAVLEKVDVIFTPMSAITAFGADGPMPTEILGKPCHGGMSVLHGMLANLANLPAMSVPAGLVAGMPIGLQIIGRRFREDVCLRLARVIEQAQPWPLTAPGYN